VDVAVGVDVGPTGVEYAVVVAVGVGVILFGWKFAV
jgi:hypothetical protein